MCLQISWYFVLANKLFLFFRMNVVFTNQLVFQERCFVLKNKRIYFRKDVL